MIIAVDTGGTKTLIACFNSKGEIQKTLKFPTPPSQKEYLLQLKKIIIEQLSVEPVDAITIGLPGIIRNGIAVWCNNLQWKDFNVVEGLSDIAQKTRLFVANDANLAGLAETKAISPLPQSSLYVTVSTGIGTGFITNGEIDPGLQYSEGGRMPVEFNGIIAEWESFASGKAIRLAYNSFARDITSQSTWDEIADRISRGLLVAIPLTQPEIIIIGGSIGTYFDRYSNQLKAILRRELPQHINCPSLIQAQHPEEAVIYGCYYYAIDQLTRT